MRILKTRKYGTRSDLTSQAMAMQDRLERVMGCAWAARSVDSLMDTVEDETPLDQNQSGNSNYLTVRTTEFYGLGCEEWLTLIIKVSSCICFRSGG